MDNSWHHFGNNSKTSSSLLLYAISYIRIGILCLSLPNNVPPPFATRRSYHGDLGSGDAKECLTMQQDHQAGFTAFCMSSGSDLFWGFP